MVPLRLWRGEDPLQRFKALWAGVFVEGDEEHLSEITEVSESTTESVA